MNQDNEASGSPLASGFRARSYADNRVGLRVVRSAAYTGQPCQGCVKVALDGSMGATLEQFVRDLVKVFEEQGRGLLEGGVDLIIIETAQDILEVKASIFGVREAFKATGRTGRGGTTRLPKSVEA